MRINCNHKSTLSVFTRLILLCLVNRRFSNTRSSTILSWNQSIAQSGSICGPAHVPGRIHLLAGPSSGRLPSAINHAVIHPPLAPLVKWGRCPFRHAASKECGMRRTRHTHTHTLMEMYPKPYTSSVDAVMVEARYTPCH